MVDQTSQYWEAVLGVARAANWPEVRRGPGCSCAPRLPCPCPAQCAHAIALPCTPALQDQLTKLRQRQILRSLANKTPFTKAAIEVVRASGHGHVPPGRRRRAAAVAV